MRAFFIHLFILALAALMLVGCSATSDLQAQVQRIGRLVPPSLTTPTATPGAVAASLQVSATATPALSPTESAVRAVITRADAEQQEAFTKHDPTVMQDTSTSSYYQQLVQTNQQLAKSGVSAIKLLKIEWGSFVTKGTTVTATNFETWQTTTSNNATVVSRDRNIYTLVKQNGTWKIQTDAHPDANSGQPSGSAAPAPSGLPPVPSPSVSPAPPSLTPVSSSTQAAVRAVITRGNAEQQEAFAKHDPTVMQDTSTSSYYKELVQTNQDLLSSGVTGIKLLKLEWGPIGTQGSTVTATTFETWQTTFNNSTTVVSRERNVYTLVQQNGAWKIQADAHPDANSGQPSGSAVPLPPGLTPVPSASASPAPPGLTPVPPVIEPDGAGKSNNWSGYVATGGNFSGVSGTWKVPSSAPTGGVASGATWVGIGGVQGRDLIQAGTEETNDGSGDVRYDAWVEMLPQSSHPVALAVSPGDSVTVSLKEQGSDQWLVSFKNNTTGKSYQTTLTYASSGTSAEWIEEAPSTRRNLIPLDAFGTVQFSNASAIENGKTVSIAQADGRPITMVNQDGNTIAVPSSLAANGSGFSVSRVTPPATSEPSVPRQRYRRFPRLPAGNAI